MGNHAAQYGGGIYLYSGGNAIISHCLFLANDAYYGGAIACTGSNPQILNCTLIGSIASYGGGLCLNSNSGASIQNTIVEGSVTGYGILIGSSPNTTMSYCDFYDNLPGHFVGTMPPGTGILSGVNINGDSCDVYHNIFEYPIFVNPSQGDFHLQAGSPCIDAGDPVSPLDPDGTITDIGAFYYDQTTVSPVSVSLTPVSPPIQIPSIGGMFGFDVAFTNNASTSVTFQAWIMVQLPDGTWYGPVLGPISLTLSGGAVLTRLRNQSVPGSAPPGTYTYECRAGAYPDSVWDDDSFTFVKLGSDGIGVTGWNNFGEDFHPWQSSIPVGLPASESLSVYPNPFNPELMIRYSLAESGPVRLMVSDLNGRMIAVLADGWQEAGSYELKFDGSNLASGLFLCTLNAMGASTTQKIVLIK